MTAALDKMTKQMKSQGQEAARKIESLSTEIKHANEKNAALSTDLNDAAKAASWVQEKLISEIESLKKEVLKSKQDS
eukprot:CAMPEP_0172563976 /NCGR_PEP_ID=MMETSP1067-20121228/102511_1 /TAXON_ID=265564 ORGANISM="Thalassiosira punctigera, Strain Tpunct2005C2" /NCGR_SAMPLE_ID=MMETSP1067 /ASSEMBLY_ACC=CAM_ASM_000444 /LENGTH=76 /DNA_ID=CAMNT_0013354533 /DNA_START=21 /DNA_END=248 /DNA_ORIENTATION=+